MKKILCFVLAAAMALSLAACGNGSNGNASDGNTIKVGVIANTSGDSSQYGIAVSQGAKLYIKQLNEEGGINGKQNTRSRVTTIRAPPPTRSTPTSV